MNITTFELPIIFSNAFYKNEKIEFFNKTNRSAFCACVISLILSLDKDLQTKTTDEQLSEKVHLSLSTIKRVKSDFGYLFDIVATKHKVTQYVLKSNSLLQALAINKENLSDYKKMMDIITSFELETLTINNCFIEKQYDMFSSNNIEQEASNAEQASDIEQHTATVVKEEKKSLSKEDKKVLTEKLKKFFDAYPSFKQDNKNYYIASVKICEALILSGFTFEQIEAETLRNNKSFSYSKAVLLSSKKPAVQTSVINKAKKIDINSEDIF